MMGRLIVGKQDVHTIFQEEPPECSLAVGLPATVNESGAKFSEHHKRQQDGVGFFEQRHRLLDSLAEIDISVGVERGPSPPEIRVDLIPVPRVPCRLPYRASTYRRCQRRSRRFRGFPAMPEPSASVSTAASLRLLPDARARCEERCREPAESFESYTACIKL